MNKIIIIGAGRSGTNMLRDILVRIPGIGTWDCDEINPIWKHKNLKYSTDELQVSDASPKVKSFIRKEFDKIQRSTTASIIVEKTCANSLRVPFVYSIFPEAKYIFIFRDGRDVVPSAMKRWKSKIDISYTLKKLRYVPIIDLPFYLIKYGLNRIIRMFSSSERLSFWGPIYKGMNEDVENHNLAYVCARQWAKCAESAKKGMKIIPTESKYNIQYEEFVQEPEKHLKSITSFLNIDLSEKQIMDFVSDVKNTSVGNYKDELNSTQLAQIMPVMEKTLSLTGYE